MKSDFVLIGWQDNDLPIFGRIQQIIIIKNIALFVVSIYSAYGIDRHYHSFVIKESGEVATKCLPNLAALQTFQGHIKGAVLYITFRSFIENTNT